MQLALTREYEDAAKCPAKTRCIFVPRRGSHIPRFRGESLVRTYQPKRRIVTYVEKEAHEARPSIRVGTKLELATNVYFEVTGR